MIKSNQREKKYHKWISWDYKTWVKEYSLILWAGVEGGED